MSYELHLCPPDYPVKMSPWRCRHEPQYIICAGARIAPGKRGNVIEIDHSMCLACGAPRPCTHGGNVFVDCAQILGATVGSNWKIAVRVKRIGERWARIALRLFDESGWNGRHEAVARLIDRNLTMKIAVRGHEFLSVKFDREYLRDAEA
jgi:hypothetical protein